MKENEKRREFLRQIQSYNPIEPASQPSLSKNGDTIDGALDIAISGTKKIKEDPELRKMLYEIYHDGI